MDKEEFKVFWYETILLPLLLAALAFNAMIIAKIYKRKLAIIATAIAASCSVIATLIILYESLIIGTAMVILNAIIVLVAVAEQKK